MPNYFVSYIDDSKLIEREEFIHKNSYLHPTEQNKSAKFLVINQITLVATHVLVWLCYSIITHGMHRSTFGLRFLVPLAFGGSLLPPCFCLIHWSVNIRYKTRNVILNIEISE